MTEDKVPMWKPPSHKAGHELEESPSHALTCKRLEGELGNADLKFCYYRPTITLLCRPYSHYLGGPNKFQCEFSLKPSCKSFLYRKFQANKYRRNDEIGYHKYEIMDLDLCSPVQEAHPHFAKLKSIKMKIQFLSHTTTLQVLC